MRLGADVVVDHAMQDFEKELSGYDTTFDLIPSRRSRRTTSVDVRLSRSLLWLASAGGALRAWHAGVAYRYLFMQPGRTDPELLASRSSGPKTLEAVVGAVFPYANDRRGAPTGSLLQSKGFIVLLE